MLFSMITLPGQFADNAANETVPMTPGTPNAGRHIMANPLQTVLLLLLMVCARSWCAPAPWQLAFLQPALLNGAASLTAQMAAGTHQGRRPPCSSKDPTGI